MKFTSDESLLFFEYAESKNFAFLIDWKFSAKDLVFNIKNLLPEIDISAFPEKKIDDNWVETVKIGEKEYQYNIEDEYRMYNIMKDVNEYLSQKINKVFVLFDSMGDEYEILLIEKNLLPEYIEKGFRET